MSCSHVMCALEAPPPPPPFRLTSQAQMAQVLNSSLLQAFRALAASAGIMAMVYSGFIMGIAILEPLRLSKLLPRRYILEPRPHPLPQPFSCICGGSLQRLLWGQQFLAAWGTQLQHIMVITLSNCINMILSWSSCAA